MQSLKQSCLAYQLGVRPATQRMSSVHIPLSMVVESLNTVLSSDQIMPGVAAMGCPEEDAIAFYMLNHAVSVIRSNYHPFEDLGSAQEVLEVYNSELVARARRMFFYLLVICTRESRHTKDVKTGPLLSSLRKEFGDEIADFHWSLRGLSSLQAVEALKKRFPETTLGQYTRFLYRVFDEGNYTGGYGGKAWAKIAAVLNDYVQGILSAEMMLDTAFTLAHNNGPIFNKGVLFEHYTPDLIRILDVQRSGQIPKLVGNKEGSYAIKPVIKGLWGLCQPHALSDFDGYVDWYLVESLGAVKSYTSEKHNQEQKYGIPKGVYPKEKGFFHKKKTEQTSTPKNYSSVEVYPGFSLSKAEVKR